MTRRTGGSTKAAPSVPNNQVQSEGGGQQANQPPEQPLGDQQANSQSTALSDPPAAENGGASAAPEPVNQNAGQSNYDTPVGDTNKPLVEKVEDTQGAKPDIPANSSSILLSGQSNINQPPDQILDTEQPKDKSNPDPPVQSPVAEVPAQPEVWILKVQNNLGSRLYEPYSNMWLESYSETKIESSSLKQHQLVMANVKELSRLKRGKVVIIND